MDRDILLAPKADLASYKETIDKYLPFVLIRCAKYTNSKRLAEIIAVYAFICAYLLTEILDGANKIEILLDNMVGVIGEDLGKGTDCPVNGQLLFNQLNIFCAAKKLAELDIKVCLDEILLHKGVILSFDREQFKRITNTVMNYLLKNSSQHLADSNALDNGRRMR
jgi:hypothetical protein